MSLALDIALYTRENKIDGLTLSDRGFLYTLAFRCGSNPFTWVTQKELAFELDIHERKIRQHISKLKKLGLIESRPDPKDKRRNITKPSQFLINYHQSRRTKKHPKKAKESEQ
jgi:DNA-binding MarR family transcriptional regulator